METKITVDYKSFKDLIKEAIILGKGTVIGCTDDEFADDFEVETFDEDIATNSVMAAMASYFDYNNK